MVNQVEALVALLNVRVVGETASQRTNLCPVAAVAVRLTLWPLTCAPVSGVAVPIAVLLELTVTGLPPASQTALIDTAPLGIVNVAVCENLLLMLAFVKPLGGVGVVTTSQRASA